MTLVVLEIEQKRPVNNSLQNGSRDPQFCMKIDLALLIPTIYITPFVQKWHLEQNGSQATCRLVTGCNPNDLDIWTDWCRLGLQFVVYKSAEQEWSFVN